MTSVESTVARETVLNPDYTQCAACDQQVRSKQQRHHDHFVKVIRRLWDEIGAQQGLTSYYLHQHLNEVIVREKEGENRKQVAAGLCVACMRFNTPVMLCGDCNVVDSLMRGGEQFRDARNVLVTKPAHFTLRLQEIRDCVWRSSDGSRRLNSDPHVVKCTRRLLLPRLGQSAWR